MGLALVSPTHTLGIPISRSSHRASRSGRRARRPRAQVQPDDGSHRVADAAHRRRDEREGARDLVDLHVGRPGEERDAHAALREHVRDARRPPAEQRGGGRPRRCDARAVRSGGEWEERREGGAGRGAVEDHGGDDAPRDDGQACCEREREEAPRGQVQDLQGVYRHPEEVAPGDGRGFQMILTASHRDEK